MEKLKILLVARACRPIPLKSYKRGLESFMVTVFSGKRFACLRACARALI